MGICGKCGKGFCFYLKYMVLPVAFAAFANIVFNALNEGMDGWGGVPRTLAEETDMCPVWVMSAMRLKLQVLVKAHDVSPSFTGSPADVAFHPSWAGEYFIAFKLMGDALLKAYGPRYARHVKIPTMTASPPSFQASQLVAPDRDIDDPVYFSFGEPLVPRVAWKAVFPTIFNCMQGVIRDLEFDDQLGDNVSNTWGTLVKAGTRKKDFVSSYYTGSTLYDGVHRKYPTPENELSSLFLKADIWDDGLEKALAFDLIGAHRIESVQKTAGGETLPFKLALNSMMGVPVRPHFGKYGVDMFFTAEGLPALVVTTDGREVMRGDKDWQYWKFVWRSTLVSTITLIDHLHLTHFRSANLLARAARSALPADHPMRRFLSIFTFGSVFINNLAMHMLIGERSPLHRATGFSDFSGLGAHVSSSALGPIVDWHKPLLYDAEYEKLPQLVKDTPYFADGKLLMGAVRKMVRSMISDAMGFGECKNNKFKVEDVNMIRFLKKITMDEAITGYSGSMPDEPECESLYKWFEAMIWTVTGWHRHVGKVADFILDPDLAGFSWREGESFTRPKQAMLMSVVGAVTGTPHPKLIEDYSHLFVGIKGGEKMTQVWHSFQTDLGKVEAEVLKRNQKRLVKNSHAMPSEVECSVAV